VTLGLSGDRPMTVPAMPRPRRNLVNTVMRTWVKKNWSLFGGWTTTAKFAIPGTVYSQKFR